MDLTLVYDDYPAMAMAQLADLAFARDGDVRSLIHADIATRALPVNTSGGQLSAGQAGAAGGLHGVVEAVRQLRGEAGARQVPARVWPWSPATGWSATATAPVPAQWSSGAADERASDLPLRALWQGVVPGALALPGCGGSTLERVPAGEGVVEEATTLHRPRGAEGTVPGMVTLDAHPAVIARLEDGASAGARVLLHAEDNHVIWARRR